MEFKTNAGVPTRAAPWRLPIALLAHVKEEAARTGRSQSVLVRALIEEGLVALRDENGAPHGIARAAGARLNKSRGAR